MIVLPLFRVNKWWEGTDLLCVTLTVTAEGVCAVYVSWFIWASVFVVLMYSAAKVPELLMAIIVVAVSAVVSCPTTFACVAQSSHLFPLRSQASAFSSTYMLCIYN